MDMADTRKKDMVETKDREDAQPVDELTKAKQELEYSYKRIEELEGQNKALISNAQKLYQENQTLRASLKAIASLL